MKVKALHEKREYINVREMIEDIGERYCGKPAYRYRKNPHDKEAIVVNYETLRDNVRAYATEIIARGYQGKKIALIGKHTYGWIETYYAVLATGSVLIPLDRDWSAEDLASGMPAATFHYVDHKCNRVIAVANMGDLTFDALKAFTEEIANQQDQNGLVLLDYADLMKTSETHTTANGKYTEVYEAELFLAPAISRFELDGFSVSFSATPAYDKVEVVDERTPQQIAAEIQALNEDSQRLLNEIMEML